MVFLLPFATAWVARSQTAPTPVAVYGIVFLLVDVAYLVFERAVFAQADATTLPNRARMLARRRTLAALAIFGAAALIAPFIPLISFGIICSALFLYLRPEAFSDHGAHPSH
jgi:Predicted integral membrane protein